MKLAPSMERADWLNLETEIKELEKADVDLLHIDIMDRTYGSRILLSPNLVPMIKKVTNLPVDVHMYVTEPEVYFETLFSVMDNNDYINFQFEAPRNISRLLTLVKNAGIKTAVTLEIATPVEALNEIREQIDMVNLLIRPDGCPHLPLTQSILEKISKVKSYFKEKGLNVEVEVDGSVTYDDALDLKKYGSDILVLGSKVVFRKGHSYKENCDEMRKLLK